jgi:murein L,D-transpeptidase YcbB/YkuD
VAQYRSIASSVGWPKVAAGPSLRPGEQDDRVPRLRERLRVTQDLYFPSDAEEALLAPSSRHKKTRKIRPSESLLYDAVLVGAVKKFQRRHNLETDGVVGGETVTVLNVSIDTRIQQIIANMDRWRALPPNLGDPHIVVNIPNFTLDVIAGEEVVLHMKVVVGKMVEERNTPTFSAQMSYLVLNPYWHVPKSIAEKELFPLSRKDPQYFAKNNFIVRRVQIGEQLEPDPNATDGSMISKKIYQYRLKQAPGPKNALGRIKFIFPNPYGVYLHDTPSKSLFSRTVRTYSHGCIRIEKPIELAEYLLQETSGKWTREAILSTIHRQKEKTVHLPMPVPVYIQYWTAWVDAEGEVQFRNDIYGYDKAPGARLPVSTPRPRPQPQPSPPQDQPVLQPPLSPTPQAVPPMPSPVETQRPL